MRKRRIVKWLGLVVCVVLPVVFVASLTRGAKLSCGHGMVAVQSGCIGVGYYHAPQYHIGFHAGRRLSDIRWLPFFEGGGGDRWFVVPIWVLLMLIGIPTIIAWRLDRPYAPGHCKKCGYDLTGNVSGVCPECGVECAKV